MLYRASVQDVKEGRVSKRYGYLVVVMQYYPRFLPKEKINEYVHALAPDRQLFTEFKEKEKELGDHDEAFGVVEYEKRFTLTSEGEAELKRLGELSVEQNVYLICQCNAAQRCHGDLLLLLAKQKFGTAINYVRKTYPIFSSRTS